MCNTFRKKLGEQIKQLRIQKGLTQEELSLESGISRSHIAMIESGKRDMTLSALFKISRALGKTVKKIFEFDNLEKYTFDVEELYK